MSQAGQDAAGLIDKAGVNLKVALGGIEDTMTQAGERSAELINTAGETLKSTLGDIDSKIANMKESFEKEAEQFRTSYTESLNEFFGEQNKALEETLGVQNKTLQQAVVDLNDAFDKMSKQQGILNVQTSDVFVPLLGQMQTVSEAVGRNYGGFMKHLNETLEKLDKYNSELDGINRAFTDLGNTLNTSFVLQFETLNNEYISKQNEMNQYFVDRIKELTIAAAAVASQGKTQ